MKSIFADLFAGNQIKKLTKFFIFAVFSFGAITTIHGQTITLSTTTDEVNGNTSGIAALIGTPGGAGISLREAILAANNEPNGSVVTITMPAGTFTTTIAGAAENLGVSGDIDVNVSASAGMKTVTINGAGAGVTIITGSTGERVFDVHPVNNPGSITFNLSGVTISGTTIASASGAALLLGRAGDISNISNCVFSGNSAPNSGAITQSSSLAVHDLTVTNCTFTNNTATSGGPGALNYNGIGNVTITGCTFTGNTAAGQGGAINISGGGTGPVTTNILRNTFLNNTANGTQIGGAAVAITNAQTVNINFNRLFGNTSPSLNTGLSPNFGDGRIITASGGTIGTLNVENNWWGVNSGPVTTATSRSVFGATPTRWLNLRNTASPSPICIGATSTITASFLANNLGEAIAPANLTALAGQPITINASVNGTLSAAQTTIQAAGTATVTFTATGAGAGSANAVFVPLAENFTATTSPTISVLANNTSGVASSTPTLCISAALTNITHSTTGATGIANNGLAGTNGLPAGVSASWASNTITISGAPMASGTFNYSIPLTGGCGNVNATGTITVNASSVAPTGATGTTTICNGSNTNLTVTGGVKGTGASTQWYTGSCGGSLLFTGDVLSVSPAITTNYFVRYAGTCNTTTCATVQVTVNNPSVAPTSISGQTTICTGSSTTLTAVGGTLGTGANYQWGTGAIVGTSPLVGQTAVTLTVSPGGATTYWVRIENTATPCAFNTPGTPKPVTVNNPPNNWTGAVSTAWENPNNWACGVVADANTDVVINSGAVIVTSNAICRSLNVKPGASITTKTGFSLKVMQ